VKDADPRIVEMGEARESIVKETHIPHGVIEWKEAVL